MPLRELSEEDCPLLTSLPHLRTQYNALVADLLRIRAEKPMLARNEDVQKIERETEALAERLQRKHYYVGFLGLFQVGKSTTFNAILKATDEETQPVFVGRSGKPTTATVTRVHATKKQGEGHKLTLRYLTRAQYERKRDSMHEAIAGLAEVDPDWNEDELLRKLPPLVEEAHNNGRDHVEANLTYCHRLIKSKREHGQQVLRDGEQGLTLDKPYDKNRHRYTRHMPEGQGEPTQPLIRDVQIRFDTDVLPRQVEIIDMPGLGMVLEQDTITTEELMETLDGVLIFYQATKDIAQKELARVFDRLKEIFREDFQKRVWVVFSRCDDLTTQVRDTDENLFKTIDTFLQNRKIAPEQVCFVCNQWIGLSSEEIAQKLTALAGTPDLRAKFPDHPGIVQAFLGLVENGGVDRLRELITTTIGKEVERETQRDQQRTLLRLTEDLRQSKELFEQQSRFDRGRQAQIQAVLNGIKSVLYQVDNRQELLSPTLEITDYFSAPAAKLHEELASLFNEIYPEQPWLRGERLDQVAAVFPGHAQLLEETLHGNVTGQFLPEVYNRVGQDLACLPHVPVQGCVEGIGPRWEERTAADRRERAWRSDLGMPTFQSSHLFVRSQYRVLQALNGEGYRSLMLEKIQLVAHQTARAVRMRIRSHLCELEQAYRKAAEAQEQLAGQQPVGK